MGYYSKHVFIHLFWTFHIISHCPLLSFETLLAVVWACIYELGPIQTFHRILSYSCYQKSHLENTCPFSNTNSKVLFNTEIQARLPFVVNHDTASMCSKAQEVTSGLAEVIGNSVTDPAPQAHKAITPWLKLMNTDLNNTLPLISNKIVD